VQTAKSIANSIAIFVERSFVDGSPYAIGPLLPAALRAAHRAGIWFTLRPILRPILTRFTDGVKFGTKVPSSIPNFTHIGATVRVYWTPKLKFLLRFDQNVEYRRLTGAYPLRDFPKICRVCTSFQDALTVKISLDVLKGLWSYEGFKLTASGCTQIFSAP